MNNKMTEIEDFLEDEIESVAPTTTKATSQGPGLLEEEDFEVVEPPSSEEEFTRPYPRSVAVDDIANDLAAKAFAENANALLRATAGSAKATASTELEPHDGGESALSEAIDMATKLEITPVQPAKRGRRKSAASVAVVTPVDAFITKTPAEDSIKLDVASILRYVEIIPATTDDLTPADAELEAEVVTDDCDPALIEAVEVAKSLPDQEDDSMRDVLKGLDAVPQPAPNPSPIIQGIILDIVKRKTAFEEGYKKELDVLTAELRSNVAECDAAIAKLMA